MEKVNVAGRQVQTLPLSRHESWTPDGSRANTKSHHGIVLLTPLSRHKSRCEMLLWRDSAASVGCIRANPCFEDSRTLAQDAHRRQFAGSFKVPASSPLLHPSLSSTINPPARLIVCFYHQLHNSHLILAISPCPQLLDNLE
jgi:hypothetical protein